jgi:hypothetical protein
LSVPYDTAAYEPPESHESHQPDGTHQPDEHLGRLLGRALNSFELPDEALARLDCALAYDSSLHSAHHSAGLHRETYRHTWLLADGSALTLWELVHNTMPERGTQHEVYTSEEDLRLATDRLPLPREAAPEFELPLPLQLPSIPEPRRSYAADDSADHARRLLRRAENEDRPGPDTVRLLHTAYAHQITQAFGRPRLGFTLYEHAFLLHDGSEISLWEIEHTATPDGRHMCEVYATQDEARAAMQRRATDRSRPSCG